MFIVGIGLYNAVMTPYYIYGQSLLHFYKLSAGHIGLIFSVIQISACAFYLSVEHVRNRLPFTGIIATVLIGSSLLIAANALAGLYLTVAIFVIVNILPDISDIFVSGYMQQRVPSRLRASLLSSQAFVTAVLTACGYFGFGILMDHFPVNLAFASMCVVPLISLALCSWHFSMEKKGTNERKATMEAPSTCHVALPNPVRSATDC